MGTRTQNSSSTQKLASSADLLRCYDSGHRHTVHPETLQLPSCKNGHGVAPEYLLAQQRPLCWFLVDCVACARCWWRLQLDWQQQPTVQV